MHCGIIRYIIIPFFWLVFIPVSAQGQELSSDSKRAVRQFEEGNRKFNLGYFAEAGVNLENAVSIDKHFLEAYLLLADVYKSLDENEKALEAYQKVISLDKQKYPEAYYFSGVLLFEIQDYSLAIRRLHKFLQYPQVSPGRRADAIFYKSCAGFAMEAIRNPVHFNPENAGSGVNTTNDEYINAVRADGLTIFFTGRQSTNNGLPGGDDFYFSRRNSESSGWSQSIKLGPPVNTPGDEGALTISPDGRYFLFAGCHWPQGFGSCDIYISKISGSTVGEPHNLGARINTSVWESQPSISSDGRTLYFSSTRSGGSGKSDIWKSYLKDNGHWSVPQNLGREINTTGSEMAPFIHPDGQTLYFSSDRHVGMGGIDLFMSRLDSLGKWGMVQNLGYPLNTPGDEINIVVDAAGEKGFISADKLGGYGGYDIFEFDLHEAIRPVPSTYMKGVVTDAVTGQPLEAYFSLIDLQNGKEIVRSFSDKLTGEFMVCIPTNREYALNVSKENYLFYSDNFSLSGIKTDIEPYQVDIQLQPVTEGKIMVLRNIFFDTGKFEIKTHSIVELNKLVEFLKFNPNVKIEIQGHTDNVGSESFNLELSQNRAKAVYRFLIDNDIRSSRLHYKGYGFSEPVSENSSEEGRALNRRTEIKIIEIDE